MSLFAPVSELAERFDAEPELEIEPSYNVAPTQEHPVILNVSPSTITELRWGLVPPWSESPEIGNSMINARSETLREKRSFREPFERRRALVLADGFYEWKKIPRGGNRSTDKQPYRVTLENEEPFAMAGLWERWRDKDGEELRTFTIITTEPNEMMSQLHDRMPVILAEREEEIWLEENDTDELEKLLDPYPSEGMRAYPVSKKVNDPENESPEVVEEVEVDRNQKSLDEF